MNYDQATEEIMERKPEEGNEIIEDQGQISSGNILQNIFSNIKYLYSLDDLLREYELNSTGFFR